MIIVVLTVLGLIFGSFVNALVWRLHEQEGKSKKSRQQYSILNGHSMCPNCHHELAAKDLVPVLSWLWLRGKCRYCRKPISWQYPAVELMTGLLFVGSYLWWPLSLQGVGLFQFVVWLGFIVGFMALAVYDLRWFTLPNRIVYPLIAL
ncbi:MAG TPA: prepilin peptidase, partial [Candidatus Saccharimonadales bacterium]